MSYQPNAKAEELPSLIGPYKILVVRSKQVAAETIKASSELALVLRAGAGVNTIDVKAASTRCYVKPADSGHRSDTAASKAARPQTARSSL